ncbi:MAG: chromosome partitioning protein, partial [Chloroflexi bacterium]|nr:chromosome partitioning protein [Chloroflexota bacterium]
KATDGVFLSVKAGVTPIEDMLQASRHIGTEKMMGVILGDAASVTPQWLQRLLHEV